MFLLFKVWVFPLSLYFILGVENMSSFHESFLFPPVSHAYAINEIKIQNTDSYYLEPVLCTLPPGTYLPLCTAVALCCAV